MAEEAPDQPHPGDCAAEITRLNKIIRVLMDRAERSTDSRGDEFTLFQANVMLERQVRSRTAELQAALKENERITRALSESEARYRNGIDQSVIGIATVEDGRISYSNAKFNEIFGYTSEEVRTRAPIDFAAPGDRELVAEMVRRRLSGETKDVAYTFQGLRKDGTAVDIECHGSVMVQDGKTVLISSILDITERCRAEHELRALRDLLEIQSTHDALTGLYNRRYLEESFRQELIRATRSGDCVSLIMADLDHFKAVNDRLGHLAGDQVLRVFGALLSSHARASDTYCRYGGEEFLVVLPGMSENEARGRAEQIRRALAGTPIAYGETRIEVTASFGVATFPQHGRTGDSLIAAADAAMYAAKQGGRNRTCVATADGSGHAVPPPRPAVIAS